MTWKGREGWTKFVKRGVGKVNIGVLHKIGGREVGVRTPLPTMVLGGSIPYFRKSFPPYAFTPKASPSFCQSHKIKEGGRNYTKSLYPVGRKNMWIHIGYEYY